MVDSGLKVAIPSSIKAMKRSLLVTSHLMLDKSNLVIPGVCFRTFSTFVYIYVCMYVCIYLGISYLSIFKVHAYIYFRN